MDSTSNFPSVITQDGLTRYLACLPRADRGGLPRLSAENVISRDQWQEIDLSSSISVPVLNQGNHGSCVGHGSTSAFWFAYLIGGGTVPDSGFSPTSLYALINGGFDGGAVVSDAMTALMQQGICTMAECPESVIFERQIPTSAAQTRKRFRVSDAYSLNTFDEIGSALQLGFPVSFGITLGRRFMDLDSEGVCGVGGFPLGGHCLCAYGTHKLNDGTWAVRVRNSWGSSWGVNGNCLLVEGHFGSDTDAFAVQADISDPNDPNLVPSTGS